MGMGHSYTSITPEISYRAEGSVIVITYDKPSDK